MQSRGSKKIAELRPDIILLDVQMPEMSGMEMAQYLRDHAVVSGVPAIIFITAYDEFAFLLLVCKQQIISLNR
jgi:DNA-binding LytR/AlgR family response regulator